MILKTIELCSVILWVLSAICHAGNPGDCIVSEWGEWESCSKKCSSGTKLRSKKIIKPLTNLFDKPCPPESEMSQTIQCGVKNNGCEQFCDENNGKCGCKNGLKLKEDGKTCADYDECFVNFGRGPCNQKCVNTIGSYYCKCNPSYFLADDKHNCFFNKSANPCNFETHEYDDNDNCICKESDREGLKCNQDKYVCKNSQCATGEICLKFVHFNQRCVGEDFVVPLLLPLPYENYLEGNFKYLVEIYVTEILEGSKPKPLFSQSQWKFNQRNDRDQYFYTETVKSLKSKSFSFVQLIVLDTKDFSPVEKKVVCSKLSGTDIHCLDSKECNILKSDGKECPFVYSNSKLITDEEKSSKTWIVVVICLIILVIIVLVIFFFIKRKRGWKQFRINFNRRNEEVVCQNESPLLNTNEPPPPYTVNDEDNLQHIENFDSSVFTGEPSKKGSEKHIYESVENLKLKLPGYSEYEAMDGNDKKDLRVDLADNDEEPRYVAPVRVMAGESSSSNTGPSVASDEHYSTRISNRPLSNDDYEDVLL